MPQNFFYYIYRNNWISFEKKVFLFSKIIKSLQRIFIAIFLFTQSNWIIVASKFYYLQKIIKFFQKDFTLFTKKQLKYCSKILDNNVINYYPCFFNANNAFFSIRLQKFYFIKIFFGKIGYYSNSCCTFGKSSLDLIYFSKTFNQNVWKLFIVYFLKENFVTTRSTAQIWLLRVRKRSLDMRTSFLTFFLFHAQSISTLIINSLLFLLAID